MLLRPPLFLFVISSFICLVINFFTNTVMTLAWLAGFTVFIIGFVIALVHSKTDKRIYYSLISIPQFMLLQIVSLLKARKANIYSVATTHIHNKTMEELKGGAI